MRKGGSRVQQPAGTAQRAPLYRHMTFQPGNWALLLCRLTTKPLEGGAGAPLAPHARGTP
jgi:hypothetical protein